jgi:hypothetical protein
MHIRGVSGARSALGPTKLFPELGDAIGERLCVTGGTLGIVCDTLKVLGLRLTIHHGYSTDACVSGMSLEHVSDWECVWHGTYIRLNPCRVVEVRLKGELIVVQRPVSRAEGHGGGGRRRHWVGLLHSCSGDVILPRR